MTTIPITPGIVNLLQNVPVTGANQLPPIESRDYGLQFVAGATFTDPATSQLITSGEIYEWFNGQWQAYGTGGGGGGGTMTGPTGTVPNQITTYVTDTELGKNGSTTLVADTFTPATNTSAFSKQFTFAQYAQTTVAGSSLTLNLANSGQAFLITNANCTINVTISSGLNVMNHWYVACSAGASATFTFAGGDSVIGDVSLISGEDCELKYRGSAQFVIDPGFQIGSAGGGTVTSVSMTVPPFLRVSGSPITHIGTFIVGLANESANTVFCGPVNGSPAAPTFRGLVTSDLPPIANNTVLSNTAGGTTSPVGNTLSNVLDSSFGNTNGEILYRGSSGWTSLQAGTPGQFLQTQGTSSNPQWVDNSGGDISGPGVSTFDAIPTWSDETGTSLSNSVVIMDPTTGATANQFQAISDTALTAITLNSSNDGQGIRFTSANIAVTVGASSLQAQGACWYLYASAATTITISMTGGDTLYGETTVSPTESVQIVFSGGTFFYVLPGNQNAGPGAGDVVGPAISDVNAISTYEDTTGKLIKNNTIVINGNNIQSIAQSTFGIYSNTYQDLLLSTFGAGASGPGNIRLIGGNYTDANGNGANIYLQAGLGSGTGTDGNTYVLNGNLIGNGLNSISGFVEKGVNSSAATLTLDVTNVGTSFYIGYVGNCVITIADSSSLSQVSWWDISSSGATTVSFVLAGAGDGDTIIGATDLGNEESCKIRLITMRLFENDPLYQVAGPGSGDVSGPNLSQDGEIVVYSGTSGKLIGNSGILLNNNTLRSHNNSTFNIYANTYQALFIGTYDGGYDSGAGDITIKAGDSISLVYPAANIVIQPGVNISGATFPDPSVTLLGSVQGNNISTGAAEATLSGFLTKTVFYTTAGSSAITLDETNVGQNFFISPPDVTNVVFNVTNYANLSPGSCWAISMITSQQFPVAGSIELSGVAPVLYGPEDLLGPCYYTLCYAGLLGGTGIFYLWEQQNPASVSSQLGVTDNHIVVYDGVTGTQVKNSALVIDPATGAITQTNDGDWFINGYAGRNINIAATDGDVILSGDEILLGSDVIDIPASSSAEAFNILCTDSFNVDRTKIAHIEPTSNPGWVLTSNGTSTAPTFQPVPGNGLSRVSVSYLTTDWVADGDPVSSTLTIPAVSIGLSDIVSVNLFETSSIFGELLKNSPIVNYTVFSDGHVEIYSATSGIFDITVKFIGVI